MHITIRTKAGWFKKRWNNEISVLKFLKSCYGEIDFYDKDKKRFLAKPLFVRTRKLLDHPMNVKINRLNYQIIGRMIIPKVKTKYYEFQYHILWKHEN